jgi:hypothetical protein
MNSNQKTHKITQVKTQRKMITVTLAKPRVILPDKTYQDQLS